MAEPRAKGPSARQIAALQRAQDAPPWEFVRMLHRFLQERDPREPIDSGWVDLWEQWGKRVKDEEMFPPDVIEGIETALKGVQRIDEDIEAWSVKAETKLAILLGAGASAPEPSCIPTVAGLLPELWRRAKKIGREDIDNLASWCESHNIVNIEDLLTAAYIANFSAKNASVTGLLDYFLFRGGRLPEEEGMMERYRRPRPAFRERMPQVDAASIAMFQETLQTLFGLLMSTMIPAPPNAAHDAIVRLLRRHANTAIITTNYDGCIDEALIRAGLPFNTHLEEAEPRTNGKVDLIKMHGSINWTYCDSCQEVRDFDLLQLKADFREDRSSYAVIGICKTCGGQRRPLLVPPLAFKFIIFPNLISIWNSARKIIEDADWLLVIGYSFSEADTYMSKIISRSLTARSSQRMIVCDPNSQLVPGLRKRFSAHIDRFDERRVLRAVGKCEEILPSILDGVIAKMPEQAVPLPTRNKKRSKGAE